MTMPETRAELLSVIREALGDFMPPADVQCTAEFPHDTLVYQNPTYHCRCGRVYVKNGRGGLMDRR